ncbi:MAG TPA: type II toxin-antitoxin system VapC family toxin [Bryobacteraceae bacterium]|nr:type II toxin-antitoxin system VapC family toxin [Bryobacteraceae bacterium]
MRFYPDASFLASLYLPDPNADPARNVFERIQERGEILLVTDLSILEAGNAIHLAAFRKLLTPEELTQTIAGFVQDTIAQIFQRTAIPSETWKIANELSRLHTPEIGCRSLDILQVAIAILLKADQFLTFDQRQRKLALAAGLDAQDLLTSYS